MTPAGDNLVRATIDLQRDVEQAIRLAINVLRGPDPRMRAEALERLEALADEMATSTARLQELT